MNQSTESSWMRNTLMKQLSEERDFVLNTPVKFRYGILCTHRSGSNMLTEALYNTGVAGDPMEYWNLRMLNLLYKERGVSTMERDDYMQEMQSRRTSPNGVFGFNVKADQFNVYFKNNPHEGSRLIQSCDFILYHTRKDKVKQAVSIYIGKMRDTFRIPIEANNQEIIERTKDIPFNAAAIADALNRILSQEAFWLKFLAERNLKYAVSTYEDLVRDYEGTIKRILGNLKIESKDQVIPEISTKKVTNAKNEELERKFLEVISDSQL